MTTQSNKLEIQRLNLSPYHERDFVKKENDLFVSLGFTPAMENGDILISNTLYDFKSVDIKEWNKKVKMLIHPNSGYDNFPVDFVQNATFPIFVGNPIRAQAVAQYSLVALLERYQKLENHKEWKPGRFWNRTLLENLKILLVGYGHIGKILKSTLSNLGVQSDLYDPDKGFTKKSGLYDVIILAASLNKTSRHLIDERFLDQHLSRKGTLINGARGALVDSKALVDFLKSNSEAFAYLDVFEREPEGMSEFSILPNVCTTSHIAGVSRQLDTLMLEFEQKLLSAFISSEDVRQDFPELLLQNRLRTENEETFLI